MSPRSKVGPESSSGGIDGVPELEALRRALTALTDRAPEPDRCLEPDRIWAAAHGDLATEERREIIDHTASCADCAEAWRLAREVGREVAGGTDQATTEPSPATGGRVLAMGHRFRRFAAPLAGLAAAAVLLLVVGLPREGPAPPELRAGETATIRSLLPAGEPLARDRCLLRWSEVAGARYFVLVSDAQLAVVARAQDLTQPRFQVPPESLAGLGAGVEIYWRVEAVLPDGSSSSSRTFVFRLE